MPPGWLTIFAWLYLSVCFTCAMVIAYDVVFNHRHQQMGVMNFVFPITALYFGPFALALYWRWGRAPHATTSMTSGAAIRDMAMTSVAGTFNPLAKDLLGLQRAAIPTEGKRQRIRPKRHALAGSRWRSR